MTDMNIHELEKKLKDLRLQTSQALDERVESLAQSMATDSDDAAGEEISIMAHHRPRRRVPWFVKLAAGILIACGILGLVMWANSNGHSIVPSAYAELADAIESSNRAEWTHFAFEQGGRKHEMWLSAGLGRVFTKDGEKAEFWDASANCHWTYDPDKNTVMILETRLGQFPFPEGKSFLDVLMAQIDEAVKEGYAAITKTDEIVDGKRRIALNVTLRVEGVEGEAACRYLINPETNRLVRAEIVQAVPGEKHPPAQTIDIEYPENGPADIYAVGVPRDAKVVNSMPGANVVKLRNSVTQAQKAFPETYTGIVAHAGIGRNDRMRLSLVWVVYKKDGAYRIEQISLACPPQEPFDNLSDFLAWTQARPRLSVKFCPADTGTKGTRIEMREPGKLSSRWAHNMRPLQGSVEEVLWEDHCALSFGDTTEQRMLPELQGEFGPLTGIERTSQGRVYKDGTFARPQKATAYFNPARGWIAERSGILWDPHAPWLKDKDWHKGVELDDDAVKKSTDVVQEYAQTPDGHWYAKRILQTSETEPSDANGLSEPRVQRSAILIYLDTEREIPDELFDPDSVTVDMFEK